jgi:predicted alpha/beta hydrolase family esterase
MAATEVACVVFVHGAGGGGWEWNVWRRVFAAHGIAGVAPDLQPSGDLATTAFADYAAQVRAALVDLPRPRALVGASLGGLLALACADAADALVLVNPIPPRRWTGGLVARDWPARVPWQVNARLDSTRRALPDADDATALFAMRHWRDESGAVLREAYAGIDLPRPACRLLCVASAQDDEVPPRLTIEMAQAWDASLFRTDSPSHVGPLLGRDAAGVAAQVAGWLTSAAGLRARADVSAG